jgi:flagellar motor switch protein FliG
MARGIFTAFVLSLILSSGVSWAQGARNKEAVITPSASSQKALVRHAFENELQAILQKYLKPHQYAMDINFKMPADVKGIGDVPYAPDTIVPESFQGLPDANQLKKLQELNVKILVPQWMDGQTKSTLQNLLSKRLEQLTGTLVPLTLQGVTLNVEEPARPLPGMSLPTMPAAADQSREIEELKAQVLKEREQFREELRELQDKLGGSQNEKPGVAVPTSSGNAFQNFWEFAKANPLGAAVVLLLIYAGIFTLAFLPSRSMASGLGSIQNAFGAIAKSIKGVADSMARSSSGSSSLQEDAERPAIPSVSAPVGGAAVATSSKSQLPSYPELREMLQDLQKQHKAHSDPIVMEMLQGFLTQGDKAFKAVLVLELLGPQHANRVFDQLASDQKDQLLRLIQRAEHAVADKTEALYELAEAYQTRLLASAWKGGTRATLSEELQRLIGGLKADEISLLARQLQDEDALRRFMLYLDAPMLVQLIQSFKRQPQDKELILKSLAAMPEALDASHADRGIESVIQQYLTRKREDRYLPYLAHYESIIKQSGEDMEDELIEQISRNNPAVGRQLRRRVVTLGSFFAQPDSIRADLLEPFSNYELAALAAAFPDEGKRTQLLNSMDARRRELVQEQMHMLVDENKYALAETQRHLKARLKEALRLARANQGEDAVEEAPQEEVSTASDAAA